MTRAYFETVLLLIYGILILVGGFIGHWKAGSQASLVSGLVFGFLLLLSAYLTRSSKKILSKVGRYGGLLLTFLLYGFFVYRFSLSRKLAPSGIMALVSLVTLLLLILTTAKKAGGKALAAKGK